MLDVTFLKDLIREDERGFWLDSRVYSDERVFEVEMERIFHRLWVYVGHESEFRVTGDFKVSRVGKYQVLLVKGDDGKVRGFINKCTHRGNVLCRVSRGNSKAFKCIYHGWVFDTKGKLIGLPDKEGFPRDYDFNSLNLREISVESYKGFIFASINPVKSLEEHLGDAKVFIDYIVDSSPGGIEVIGPVKYAYTGNWKLILENTMDLYHFPVLHASAVMVAKYIYNKSPTYTAAQAVSNKLPNSVGYLRNGHIFYLLDKEGVRDQLPSFTTLEQLQKILGPAKGKFRWKFGWHIGIMPNVIFHDYDETVPTIRACYPIRPDLTHMETWVYVPKEAPPEVKRKLIRAFDEVRGPAGMTTPDDNEVMVNITSVAEVNYPIITLAKGKHRESNSVSEIEEGGIRLDGISNPLDDTHIRGFYKWWLRYMLGEY